MRALTNCEIHTGDAVLHEHAVLLDGRRIADVVPRGAIPPGAVIEDQHGGTLAPGFVDLHVNGGGGVMFNDAPTPATIALIASAHRRLGTTDLLPTLITDVPTALAPAVEAVQACLDADVPGVLGIHLEGPFLNPRRAGVHPGRHMRRLTAGELASVPNIRRGVVLMTVAPEVADDGVIAQAVARGIRVSAGHTDANGAQMHAAFAEGLDGGTHLLNAMRPLETREPGPVGVLLASDTAACSLLVDGAHVHYDVVRFVHRARPVGLLYLVSDALPVVGAPHHDAFPVGDQAVRVVDGLCTTADGVIAGSSVALASAMRNCVVEAGIPKAEAIRMATIYPARYARADDRAGVIAPGRDANLVLLDDDLRVRRVIVRGEAVSADG